MSRRKKIAIISLSVLSGMVLLIGLMNVWVVVSANSRIYSDAGELPSCDVALVLGTSRYTVNGTENLFFTHRIDAAANLYHSKKVKKLLVSGDNGSQYYNETAQMRKALIAKGVPESDIVMDYAGFRTFDSVVRCKEVFGQQKIIIVSQRFHIQRGIFIAGSFGLEAYGYEASDPPHTATWFKVMFREVFARVGAVMDCYILGTEPRFTGPKEPIRFDTQLPQPATSPEAR